MYEQQIQLNTKLINYDYIKKNYDECKNYNIINYYGQKIENIFELKNNNQVTTKRYLSDIYHVSNDSLIYKTYNYKLIYKTYNSYLSCDWEPLNLIYHRCTEPTDDSFKFVETSLNRKQPIFLMLNDTQNNNQYKYFNNNLSESNSIILKLEYPDNPKIIIINNYETENQPILISYNNNGFNQYDFENDKKYMSVGGNSLYLTKSLNSLTLVYYDLEAYNYLYNDSYYALQQNNNKDYLVYYKRNFIVNSDPLTIQILKYNTKSTIDAITNDIFYNCLYVPDIITFDIDNQQIQNIKYNYLYYTKYISEQDNLYNQPLELYKITNPINYNYKIYKTSVIERINDELTELYNEYIYIYEKNNESSGLPFNYIMKQLTELNILDNYSYIILNSNLYDTNDQILNGNNIYSTYCLGASNNDKYYSSTYTYYNCSQDKYNSYIVIDTTWNIISYLNKENNYQWKYYDIENDDIYTDVILNNKYLNYKYLYYTVNSNNQYLFDEYEYEYIENGFGYWKKNSMFNKQYNINDGIYFKLNNTIYSIYFVYPNTSLYEIYIYNEENCTPENLSGDYNDNVKLYYLKIDYYPSDINSDNNMYYFKLMNLFNHNDLYCKELINYEYDNGTFKLTGRFNKNILLNNKKNNCFHLITQGSELLNTRSRFKEGNGTPLQYSCLENAMDRGAW